MPWPDYEPKLHHIRLEVPDKKQLLLPQQKWVLWSETLRLTLDGADVLHHITEDDDHPPPVAENDTTSTQNRKTPTIFQISPNSTKLPRRR